MRSMTPCTTFLLLGLMGLFGACATTVPRELINARAAYQRVSSGSAAQLAPAEVHQGSRLRRRAQGAARGGAGVLGGRGAAEDAGAAGSAGRPGGADAADEG